MTRGEIFFFAGELSGDLLGAELVSEGAVGVGGPAMQRAGLKPLFDFEAFQVMGFTAVIPALPRILMQLHRIKRWILKNSPKMVVLIDYAEFSLLLAKQLRKGGYRGKIVQYVCPSIWAWRKKRKKTLESYYDHLLSILPFEEKLFKKLPVTYVGHPLKRELDGTKRTDEIALFPGSRVQEVRENLPIQLKAARLLGGPIAISVARKKLRPLIEKLAPSCLLVEEKEALMKRARGALATCGTVNLELGLYQTPTVVTYKLSHFHYFLGRHLFRIRLPYYSLVNLIADRELFPEFIHKKLDASEIAQTLERVMRDPPAFWMEGAEKSAREVLNELSLS